MKIYCDFDLKLKNNPEKEVWAWRNQYNKNTTPNPKYQKTKPKKTHKTNRTPQKHTRILSINSKSPKRIYKNGDKR